MTDIQPQPSDSAPRFQPVAELIHALGFLTRLPVPFIRTIDPPPIAQSMRMFSVAGAIVGVVLGAFLTCLHLLHVPPLLAGMLTTGLGLIMTGALHEDGLADMADGFGGGKSHEQRLEIMRDSRIGSYGALALVVAVGARASAYATLLMLPPLTLIAIVAASQSFSRAMIVDLMWATRPARRDGLSAMAGRPSRNVTVFAIVSGLAVALSTGLLVKPESSIIALALALAATATLRRMAVRYIGGQTGDVCGAVQVASEIMMLSAFAARIG